MHGDGNGGRGKMMYSGCMARSSCVHLKLCHINIIILGTKVYFWGRHGLEVDGPAEFCCVF